MKSLLIALTLPAMLLAQALTEPAQFRKVDPQLTHERIVMIVPLVRSANAKNLTIPMYSDLPGIIGFTAELSDDGRMALVEFVVKDRKQLDTIVASGQRQARKDSAGKSAIYEEFKQLKRTFNSERFGVAIP